MKVYISGKIGEDVLSEATREKFARAEFFLRDRNFDVFNPTTSGLGKLAEDLAKKNGTDFYTEIMKLDLEQLKECDAIYMLYDWQDSPGAIREHSDAERMQIPVWHQCPCNADLGGVEGVNYFIDDRYFCGACQSHSHRCDPNYGHCYECDGDNWSPEPYYRDELLGEKSGL